MMRKVRILISGRVQGVYFRAFTLKKAKQLAVLGSVRNLPDGCVEIIAEANAETIQKLISWSHKGPITARVDHIDITELEPSNEFTAFLIL